MWWSDEPRKCDKIYRCIIKKITVRFGKLKYGRNANSTGMNPSVLVGLDCVHSLGRFLSVLRVGADLEKGKGGQGTCPQALRKTSTLVDCRVDAERKARRLC